jgi:hypothetical protein
VKVDGNIVYQSNTAESDNPVEHKADTVGDSIGIADNEPKLASVG